MVDISIEIIVFEILTRVPAKVVGRCKSVCKTWCSLLSTQDFAKLHCSRAFVSTNQRILFVGDLTCSVHPIDIQSCDYGAGAVAPFPWDDISIHSNLDGLLCVCLNRTSELVLWNPTTGAYKRLPTDDYHGFYEHSLDAVGLYINASEDYNVLHIKRRGGQYCVSVYSRILESWRDIPFVTKPEYLSLSFHWSSGTLCGDILYFVVKESYIEGVNVLVCFDVNLEQFKEIAFPPVRPMGIFLGELVDVRNELHMFISSGYRDMTIELWKLEGEHWVKVLACTELPSMPLDLWCSMTHFMTNGKFQFTMTNGQLNDNNDASAEKVKRSAEKRKERNARYYASQKENRPPQDPNVASTSSPSTPKSLKRKYNARCYASRRDGSTPTTTLPGVNEEYMPQRSRGITIQPRTLLPQFRDTIGIPSIRDGNVANDRVLNRRVTREVSQGICHDNVEVDPYNFVYDGIPRDHRVLKTRNPCVHCGAKLFPGEFATFCCMSGKTKLANSEIPSELYRLFTSQDEIRKTFRHHIRAYNTNFSFASMGVTLDNTLNNMRDGVYTFRAHKGIYHQIPPLVSSDGVARYLQLYFYDPDTELDLRLQWPNLDRNITQIIRRVLSTNPYVHTFRSLAELGPLDNYRVTLNASVELDQRVYNRPTTSEPYFGCYDPLSYPLFFPNGEEGWHPNIPRQGESMTRTDNNEDNIDEEMEETSTSRRRTTVAMREYYCYKFQIRSTDNVLLLGGRLLQQFVVDVYIKLETSRLQYCEQNQAKIRADLYQGVVDCVNAGEVNPNRVGRRIVLPASFIGGPRDMRRRFLDSMTIVQDDGKPDIFLTMTCNPNWPEICDNLKPGQTAQDRADLVSRVFHA
ncbi:hypothetical protein SSX86_006438 [Deinandra increscens subsp. villosa]|uniref:F-box domain-containing protein n=1 Tax=Deinandra increscens subsp. villosa TaxID=3103831 RepID=A0AAP0H5N7_9ASTR